MAPLEEEEGTPRPRLGVTVSRRVGKAVVRNRVKRAVREWFRRSREWLGGRLDVVVIARPGAGALSPTEIEAVLNDMVSLGPGARA
jgi:ribonuclease P protein component